MAHQLGVKDSCSALVQRSICGTLSPTCDIISAINPYYSRLLRTKISDEGAGLEESCVASIRQNKQLRTNFPLNKKLSTNKQSLTCHTQVYSQR